MTVALNLFKKALEDELGIAKWNPTSKQIKRMAVEIQCAGLNKCDIHRVVKKHYDGDLYVFITKGMNFKRMSDLLKLAKLAAEAVKNEGGSSKNEQ